MKKINAFQFFNKDYSVKEYSDMYKKLRLDIRYPANVKREQIFHVFRGTIIRRIRRINRLPNLRRSRNQSSVRISKRKQRLARVRRDWRRRTRRYRHKVTILLPRRDMSSSRVDAFSSDEESQKRVGSERKREESCCIQVEFLCDELRIFCFCFCFCCEYLKVHPITVPHKQHLL